MDNLNLLSDIKNFLYYYEFAKGKSLNTIKSLKIDLTRFNRYIITCKDIRILSDINSFHLREFLTILKTEKVGTRSLNRKLSSLKAFFKYLKEEDKIQIDPIELIVGPEYDRGVPDCFDKEDIDKIRQAIKIKNYHGLRDRLIVELLYSSGMTSQELLTLGEEIFNLEKREVIVTSFKKYRTVFFSETAREYFKRYIIAKKKILGDRYRKDILFTNGSASRLTARSLRRIIEKYSLKAGIKKNISPHIFRHTFAVYMLENGMNIVQLQKLLGHTNVDSTKIYLKALDKKRRETMFNREYINNKENL